ncbi:MAG: hypothetical protein LBR77_07565 [Lachnospiraceae bacterium]|jgi:hypothetical protein|nr:hypothetical protein [Lachnospiraceae bacterium]
MKNVIGIVLAFMVAFSAVGCGSGGGLPDGTYKAYAVTVPGVGRQEIGGLLDLYGLYSIEVKGDKMTFKSFGVSMSANYTYKKGSLTFKETADKVSFDITYDDGILYWTISDGIVLEMKRE